MNTIQKTIYELNPKGNILLKNRRGLKFNSFFQLLTAFLHSSQIGFIILLLLTSCNSAPSEERNNKMSTENERFDWQGHRGARGLLPENSIPAFLKALEYDAIITLEMDAAITKDSVVVISHEPWMSHHICSLPDGNAIVPEQEDNLLIYQMKFQELQSFDCGSRGNERFPEQLAQKAFKPALSEVVLAVKAFCQRNDKPLPQFNIEIKSRPEWDKIKTPEPALFAEILLKEIQKLEIINLTYIQSFDPRALEAVHEQAPSMRTVLLVDNIDGVQKNLDRLSYKPDVYSPHFKLVNAEVIKKVHEAEMKLIPWTVNETADMEDLIDLGVDGIITDYPNRIPK